jgi:hypothetical protein
MQQRKDEIARIKERKEQQRLQQEMERMRPKPVALDEKPKTFNQLMSAAA